MEKTIVRQATLSDIEGLIPLYIGFYQYFFDPLENAETHRQRTEKLGIVGLVASNETEVRRLLHTSLGSEDAAIFVADREGRLVGFTQVVMKQDASDLPSGTQPSDPRSHGVFWVPDASYREQGELLRSAAFQWIGMHKAP